MDFWDTLGQLIENLGTLLGLLLTFALHWALLIIWVVWWLFAVDWRQVWSVLGRGAWAPAVLIGIIAALVWGRLQPLAGEPPVTVFWIRLGEVALLAALALACGWLQGVFGIRPAEVSFEAVVSHGSGHEHPVGTFHGHEAAHSDDPLPEHSH
jgi:hypothetical protein